jgi:hypothetical protein
MAWQNCHLNDARRSQRMDARRSSTTCRASSRADPGGTEGGLTLRFAADVSDGPGKSSDEVSHPRVFVFRRIRLMRFLGFILENLASAIGAKLFWRGHVMFLVGNNPPQKLAFLKNHN